MELKSINHNFIFILNKVNKHVFVFLKYDKNKVIYVLLDVMYYRRWQCSRPFDVSYLLRQFVSFRDSIDDVFLVFQHTEPKINLQFCWDRPSARSDAFLARQLEQKYRKELMRIRKAND